MLWYNILVLIQQRDDIIIQHQLRKITRKLDVDVESGEFSKYLCFCFIWRSSLNSIRELSIWINELTYSIREFSIWNIELSFYLYIELSIWIRELSNWISELSNLISYLINKNELTNSIREPFLWIIELFYKKKDINIDVCKTLMSPFPNI